MVSNPFTPAARQCLSGAVATWQIEAWHLAPGKFKIGNFKKAAWHLAIVTWYLANWKFQEGSLAIFCFPGNWHPLQGIRSLPHQSVYLEFPTFTHIVLFCPISAASPLLFCFHNVLAQCTLLAPVLMLAFFTNLHSVHKNCV